MQFLIYKWIIDKKGRNFIQLPASFNEKQRKIEKEETDREREKRKKRETGKKMEGGKRV